MMNIRNLRSVMRIASDRNARRTIFLRCSRTLLPLLLVAGGPMAHASGAHPGATQFISASATAPTEGEIRKVDLATGKLTVRHGRIEHLDMEPMTMNFRVANPEMLTQVKTGDRIRFHAERIGGLLTITSLTRLP